MDFVMAMYVLLLKRTTGVFSIQGFRLEVYVSVQSETTKDYERP
jgi:hypothetical protein